MSVIAQALGIDAPGWQGRVKPAAYTSPFGTRIPFLFAEVSREYEKRTAKFEFNGLDGWYVTDNGVGGRDYPMRCIFEGADHDLIASSFEAGLIERGKGRLEHPLYGTFDVVPTGSITRRNDLVQSASETVIEVTFSTTLASIYPAVSGVPVDEIVAAIDGFNLAAALEFADVASLSSKLDQATGKATIKKALNAVRGTLRSVSDQTAASRRDFDSRFRLINDGLDVLVGQPLLLAQQINGLIQAPSRAVAGLGGKLTGYALLAERLFGISGPSSSSTVLIPKARRRAKTDFRIADLCALSAASGAILSVTEQEYGSRPAALSAADVVSTQLDSVISWREGQLETLEETDIGGAYQSLQQAAALSGGRLVDLSFELPAERRLVTERARTPVDLCAELYADLGDEQIQFFLDTNRLTGSEILEIPKGRTVVYYRAA